MSLRPSIQLLLPLLAVLLACAPAAAQPATEDAASASVRLGPLTLDPRVVVRDVGVDTNVFNEATEPVQDFTAVVGPELDSWIRLGRLQWTGTSTAAWNYYRDNRSERSIDLGQNGRLSLDLGYLAPYARGRVGRSRQRPNLEIDARVGWETTEWAGGLDVQAGPSTLVTLEHGARRLGFNDALVAGSSLSYGLNRLETASRLTVRRALTPLTTLRVAGEYRADEFEHATERDSESIRLMGGLELRPLALVSGRAYLGARRFDPASPLVPAFTGTVADVELAWQFRDLTRLVGLVERDVDYSFEPSQAYYVSTAWRLSAIQALGPGWDVVGHVGRTRLAYRSRLDAIDHERNRRDHVLVYGLGAGRRFGTELRVGFELEYATRASSVRSRSYEGLRGGGTFSYGF